MIHTVKMVNGEEVPLTQAEIDSLNLKDQLYAEARLEYETNFSYIEKRKEAYPAIGDQLDALLKQLNYMRLNGQPLIQEMDDILGQWLQVKEDYPKPPEPIK